MNKAGRPVGMAATTVPFPGEWHDDGACRAQSVNFFVVEDNNLLRHEEHVMPAAVRQEINACRTVCASCPVLAPCREYAIKYDVQGIWGGMTMRERNRNRRQVTLARRTLGHCPRCRVKTPTVKTSHGQLECLECGTRWPPL